MPSWLADAAAAGATVVISVLLSGFVSYLVARRTRRAAQQDQDRQDAYLAVRQAIANYREWLLLLLQATDIFDRGGLVSQERPSTRRMNTQDALGMVSALVDRHGDGDMLLKILEDSKYDIEGVSSEFVEEAKELIDGVDQYYVSLDFPGVLASRNPEYGLGLKSLTRDSLGLAELDAREVHLAVRFAADFDYVLRREQKRLSTGRRNVSQVEKRDSQAEKTRRVALQNGQFTYSGGIPFQSHQYRSAAAQMPWEREGVAGEAIAVDGRSDTDGSSGVASR